MKFLIGASLSLSLSLSLILALTACDDSAPTDAGADDAMADTGATDAGADAADGGTGDSSATDANADGATDASADAGPCTGACATVDLTATFGDVTEVFDRVQFGFTTTDGGTALYMEAHGGGSPECPTMSSPSPDRTLVMNGLPLTTEEPFTAFTASLLDFEGTLTTAPIAASTAASYVAGSTSFEPLDGAYVAFDLTSTYEGGTINGHGYATYCASLSDP